MVFEIEPIVMLKDQVTPSTVSEIWLAVFLHVIVCQRPSAGLGPYGGTCSWSSP